MSELLPWIFLFLAAICFLWAAYAFWQSIRSLLLGEVAASSSSWSKNSFAPLLEKKQTLLRSLKELETDHLEGKISDEDFNALDASMRQEAKNILAEIDDVLEPSRAEAQALIAYALNKNADQNEQDDSP